MARNCKVIQISKDDKIIKIYESARIAATELGISRMAIQHACTGRLKTAGGYLIHFTVAEAKLKFC